MHLPYIIALVVGHFQEGAVTQIAGVIDHDIDATESLYKSEIYYQWLNKRRSIRSFSSKPVNKTVIENVIKAASTAPSGAHKQPWTFCAISNPKIKSEIRKAAEKEEYENYHSRMSEEWLEDLKPFETNWEKPFLEASDDFIFRNTFRDIAYILKHLGEGCGTRFEHECYDIGHLYNLAHFVDAGLIPDPLFDTSHGARGGK